jgi:hypothetical protein
MNTTSVAPLRYQAVIRLDPRRHRNLGIDPHRAIAKFAARSHWAPIVTGEFAPASMHYPILFDASASASAAILLLARTEGCNPFVTGDGRWSPGAYMPQRFRCYPLVPPEGDDNAISIDEVALVPDPREQGVPLFDPQGAPAPETRGLFGVLRRHQRDGPATRRLLAWLEELDVLVPREVSIASADGWCYRLAEFRVVDPARLGGLPAVTRARLRRNGMWAVITAHIRSLANLDRLPPPRDALAESLGDRNERHVSDGLAEPAGTDPNAAMDVLASRSV